MHTHTIPDSVLQQLLEDAITAYDGPGIFAFSKGACDDRFRAARKVMNDLPELLRIYQAENETDADDTQVEREMSLAEMLELRRELDPDASPYIAFMSRAELEGDNISPAELGL